MTLLLSQPHGELQERVVYQQHFDVKGGASGISHVLIVLSCCGGEKRWLEHPFDADQARGHRQFYFP